MGIENSHERGKQIRNARLRVVLSRICYGWFSKFKIIHEKVVRRPDESAVDGQKPPRRTEVTDGQTENTMWWWCDEAARQILLRNTDLDFRFASILHPKSIDPQKIRPHLLAVPTMDDDVYYLPPPADPIHIAPQQQHHHCRILHKQQQE